MRDWDTRINTLKSDIQAAREKYVIPFMKAQPKPASPQKEVSQTLSPNPEESKVEPSVESTTEKLYENKDLSSSLDLIEKTNEAKTEPNLGLTEEITNKIDNALMLFNGSNRHKRYTVISHLLISGLLEPAARYALPCRE